MCYSSRASPDQKVSRRFLGARQHQRPSTKERAQKNLQAAVAANVVKSAPQDRGSASSFNDAPARLDNVCKTIFGRPVVPDEKRIHSV